MYSEDIDSILSNILETFGDIVLRCKFWNWLRRIASAIDCVQLLRCCEQHLDIVQRRLFLEKV